ncbi:TPA: hypothetical protein L9U43_005380 [Klebsiella pneumoniae]|uniref:hypothetical protein n=1 Tax=Klebsiella pneumoniae TaxID=573 RepID=UPI001A926AE7|nr:hypothetical protein [Klebsiella pneumoniae]EIX9273030.1 hypothetical protein [Klebsiella pneumoniae]EKZ6340767.1 hypothetical protein [Klebsiella pneumoniae]EKZ6345758.1 hypothetical protein [Klebsiella pneumoniae]ELN4457054.1 hypothetical protein [Klebsiella pneumoniae]ELN4504599.1 hypothetical protein [Klebsiella pneumoniae]
MAKKLADKAKLKHKQSLAIPQALVNLLYGQAVNYVEKAGPHREKLAQLERDLQSNYDIGRAAVDYKLSIKFKHMHVRMTYQMAQTTVSNCDPLLSHVKVRPLPALSKNHPNQ